jgi:thiamine-phosphate pyrophosphorylase
MDANANRAREATRVMEDAARFLLDDAKLSGKLKNLRHDLAAALAKLAPLTGGLEIHRDTPRDVGTSISTAGERSRGSARDVVVAAGKRLSEAMRCLEEYGKAYSAAAAQQLETLRYRGYELEKQLHEKLGAIRGRQWRLCVIITGSLCEHQNWFDVARAAVDAGADCIQLREKHLSDRHLLARIDRLTNEEVQRRFSVIVNDRPDIAVVGEADGVHLGADDLPAKRVRRLLGPERIIGISTHSLAEARRAVVGGADYCGVGAIFPTTTKPRRPSGLAYLRQFVAKYPHMPHLAIGGITPDNVSQVMDAGAKGIAVSSIVCGARKPATTVRKLLRAMV